jgi:hypothetical protein
LSQPLQRVLPEAQQVVTLTELPLRNDLNVAESGPLGGWPSPDLTPSAAETLNEGGEDDSGSLFIPGTPVDPVDLFESLW